MLLHSFDGWEDGARPWQPCPADCERDLKLCRGHQGCVLRDRTSASLVGLSGAVRLFSSAVGGVVLGPAAQRLLCSYPRDGSTRGASCSPPGVNAHCVPGCWSAVGRPWCSPPGPCGSHAAWRPEHLGLMLGDYERRLRGGVTFRLNNGPNGQLGPELLYNELIVDSDHWIEQLPHSVEGFWYPDSPECAQPASACQRAVREAHEGFEAAYPSLRGEVPLMRLRTDGSQPAFVSAR